MVEITMGSGTVYYTNYSLNEILGYIRSSVARGSNTLQVYSDQALTTETWINLRRVESVQQA